MIAYTNNTAKATGAELVVRHVVTSAEATADLATVPLDEAFESAPSYYQVQGFTSAGKNVINDATISFSGTNMIVTQEGTSPTWTLAAGDIIMVHVVK